MHGQSSRAQATVRRVGVALGYSSTLYSVTRLLGYSVTRLLGYSVTRFDATFWTTRVGTRPLQRYATIRKRPVQVATNSRRKKRFSAAVVDLSVARAWTPAQPLVRPPSKFHCIFNASPFICSHSVPWFFARF